MEQGARSAQGSRASLEPPSWPQPLPICSAHTLLFGPDPIPSAARTAGSLPPALDVTTREGRSFSCLPTEAHTPFPPHLSWPPSLPELGGTQHLACHAARTCFPFTPVALPGLILGFLFLAAKLSYDTNLGTNGTWLTWSLDQAEGADSPPSVHLPLLASLWLAARDADSSRDTQPRGSDAAAPSSVTLALSNFQRPHLQGGF